ncbi:hypothetical protein [Rhodanobacter terrae]|uniref:DUF2946 family protein n=1 Tax=Rhodanobacter terrae TaxID=418647 RepID=A0ABW0SVF9_9GAMM
MTCFRLPRVAPRRWCLRDLRRARLTRGLLLVGVLFMLGLQTALAAYACAMPPTMIGPVMAMGAGTGDAAMRGTRPEMRHATADRILCTQHCASQASAPSDARPMTVPPSLLVALPPVLPLIVSQTPISFVPERYYRLRAPPPPASLLFCSLLI